MTKDSDWQPCGGDLTAKDRAELSAWVDQRTAPTETPCLTTDQARGLASRWAFWHAGLKQCADNAEFDREMAKAPMLLADPETEKLFAWVRSRMNADMARDPRMERVDLAAMVEGNLSETIPPGEPHVGLDAAWNLCEASGWPS